MVVANLIDDRARVAHLRALDLDAVLPSVHLDRIVEVIAERLDFPIALVTAVERTEQRLIAAHGLAVASTPRSVAFCNQTMQERRTFMVTDAAVDPRFAENPLVTGDPFIRSYLGAPVRGPRGHAIGAVCAIDVCPRSFSAAEIDLVTRMARVAESEFMSMRRRTMDPMHLVIREESFERIGDRILADAAATGDAVELVVAHGTEDDLLELVHRVEEPDDIVGWVAPDVIGFLASPERAVVLRAELRLARRQGMDVLAAACCVAEANSMASIEAAAVDRLGDGPGPAGLMPG